MFAMRNNLECAIPESVAALVLTPRSAIVQFNKVINKEGDR
jgi:hypothetical protein